MTNLLTMKKAMDTIGCHGLPKEVGQPDWQTFICHPMVYHNLTLVEARALLEFFGTLVDRGKPIDRILKQIAEKYPQQIGRDKK